MWVARAIVAGAITASCAGGQHGNAAAFCARIKVDAPVLTGNPRDANAKQAAVDAFHRLKALAPSAIATDWQRLTDLIDVLANYDPAASDPFGSSYGAALDPKVQAASAHVRTWVQQTCGVTLAIDAPVTTAP